jgi:hypothetical protein
MTFQAASDIGVLPRRKHRRIGKAQSMVHENRVEERAEDNQAPEIP